MTLKTGGETGGAVDHTLFACVSLAVMGSVALASVASAIYPDDHWTYSTKLTSDNFEAKVTEEVDAGRTLFVRWIASAG